MYLLSGSTDNLSSLENDLLEHFKNLSSKTAFYQVIQLWWNQTWSNEKMKPK